jgi:uncharacterized membrane protein
MPILACLVIYTFCIPFYLSLTFQWHVVPINNSTKSYTAELKPTSYYKYYTTIHSLMRDIIPLILLVIINILILNKLRQTTNRRRNLENNQNSNKSSSMVTSSQKAEYNKIKMILYTSITYLLHIPGIYTAFYGFKYNCVYVFTALLLLISYSIPFLIYISTNQKFRKIFLNFFKKTN